MFNAYRGYAFLFVCGSNLKLLSKEGVTQGDPLAMLVYGLGLLPLIRILKEPAKWKQNFYADDGACCGPLLMLKEWLGKLMSLGPKFGYFPEPDKSFLVVHPDYIDTAREIFKDLKLNIVSGKRFLGGFIGSSDDTEQWLNDQIQKWIQSVEKLSKVARTQPQAAFVAMTKSLQMEWTFIQRVMKNSEVNFIPLKRAIIDNFLPDLFGSEVTEDESDLFCRPSRHGGIGIHDPVKAAHIHYSRSKEATRCLSESIYDGSRLDLNMHDHTIRTALKKKEEDEKQMSEETLVLLKSFSKDAERSIIRKIENKCSGWLSIAPTDRNHFDMSPDEFRDSLALRYHRLPVNLPSQCDIDGEVFSVNHALNCPRGGLVYARHNELRDLNCSLLELAGLKQIISEPIIQEETAQTNMLRADWSVRSFWEPQKQALFDGCILNADSESLKNSSLETIFSQRKNKKIQTYSKAAIARRASFNPIIATCDAVFDKEAEIYFKKLAVHLSKKWESNYSHTIGYIRARMQICILRSVSLCLRGSRCKWRGAGVEDGAALPKFNFDD